MLVLDEAVSALDVSVQAQVLNLLKDLQDELGLAYVFISHDLAVVRFMADEVLVMKDGEVVEQAQRRSRSSTAPTQEYTRRLIGAIPRGYQAPPEASAGAAAVAPAARRPAAVRSAQNPGTDPVLPWRFSHGRAKLRSVPQPRPRSELTLAAIVDTALTWRRPRAWRA